MKGTARHGPVTEYHPVAFGSTVSANIQTPTSTRLDRFPKESFPGHGDFGNPVLVGVDRNCCHDLVWQRHGTFVRTASIDLQDATLCQSVEAQLPVPAVNLIGIFIDKYLQRVVT